MKRNKGIKIKRNHKNLYRKRKSTGRKVAEVILLIVIVGGLVFLGYSVAPTVINFLNRQAAESQVESEPVWTPPVSVPSESTPETTPKPESSQPPESSEPESPKESILYAPDGTLDSASTLKKYLDSVKGSCTKVVFTLKNEKGELTYKSSVKAASDINDINKGTLTLKQIADACKAANIIPAAAISTLLDSTAPHWLDNMSYYASAGWMWLDDYADRGGKPWANPMADITSEYLSSLTAEIAKAGFKDIMLQNTMYPAFRAYDYNLLPSNVRASDRSDRLAEVAAACAKSASGAQSYIEIDAADLLSAAVTDYDASAEIIQSIAKAGGCKLIVNIDASLFGQSIEISSGKKLTVDKNAAKAIKQLTAEIDKLTGENGTAVRLSGKLTDTAAAVKAAEDAGCTLVIAG